MRSGWLLFEAGSIAAVNEHRVCTVCIDIEPHTLRPPLSFFQATVLEEHDVFKLLETLNAVASKPLSSGVLKKSFDRTWPELKAAVDGIAASNPAPPTKPAEEQLQAGDLGPVLDTLRRIEARLGALEQREAFVGATAAANRGVRNYMQELAAGELAANANALSSAFGKSGNGLMPDRSYFVHSSTGELRAKPDGRTVLNALASYSTK